MNEVINNNNENIIAFKKNNLKLLTESDHLLKSDVFEKVIDVEFKNNSENHGKIN